MNEIKRSYARMHKDGGSNSKEVSAILDTWVTKSWT